MGMEDTSKVRTIHMKDTSEVQTISLIASPPSQDQRATQDANKKYDSNSSASGAKKNTEHEAEPPECLRNATASARSSTASSSRATGVDKTQASDHLRNKRTDGVILAETKN